MSAAVVYISRAKPKFRKVVPMQYRKSNGVFGEYSREVSVFVSLMKTMENLLHYLIYEPEDTPPEAFTSIMSEISLDALRKSYRSKKIYSETFGRAVDLGMTKYGEVSLTPHVLSKLANESQSQEITGIIASLLDIFSNKLMNEEGNVPMHVLQQIFRNNHGFEIGCIREHEAWFVSGTLFTLIVPAPETVIHSPESA